MVLPFTLSRTYSISSGHYFSCILTSPHSNAIGTFFTIFLRDVVEVVNQSRPVSEFSSARAKKDDTRDLRGIRMALVHELNVLEEVCGVTALQVFLLNPRRIYFCVILKMSKRVDTDSSKEDLLSQKSDGKSYGSIQTEWNGPKKGRSFWEFVYKTLEKNGISTHVQVVMFIYIIRQNCHNVIESQFVI